MGNIPVLGEFLEWLDGMKIFGGFSVLHAVIMFIAISIVFSIIRKLNPKSNAPVYSVKMTCMDCGWKGGVSKHNKKCTKCQSTNLQRQDGN